MATVRMSSKGQIVLPRAVREALGLQKGSLLLVTVSQNTVVLAPAGEGEAPRPDWRRWRGFCGAKGFCRSCWRSTGGSGMQSVVLDAFALLAWLQEEPGAEEVEAYMVEASAGRTQVLVSSIRPWSGRRRW